MQSNLQQAVGSVFFNVPKSFTFFLLGLFITKVVSGQANPTEQSLPYSQDFSGLLHASTTYPAGWQGWTIGTSSSGTFKTNAATGDQPLNHSSSSSTTSGGVHNYKGKIGFLASGSLDPGICLSIATINKATISVSYDMMTIRNPYDGVSNTRINEVTLQYRVGTAGVFTTLTGIEYWNNTTLQTASGVTTPQNTESKTIILPSACNDQTVVQLRWIQRDVSGGGSRPGFAIDNISITGTALHITPTVIAGPASSITTVSATLPASILNDGAAAVTGYGFEYSTTNNFANGTGTIIGAGNLSSTSFSVDLTGLNASTTYYYKAYATNSGGTAYSDQLSFTTAGLSAPVTTAATNVTDNSFTANWNAVTGAEEYRLDVATTAAFTSSFFHNLVNWNFPGNPDDNIADGGGIAANTGKTLIVSGVTGTVGYTPVSSPASSSSVASVSGWHSGSGFWQVEFTTSGYYNVRLSSVQRSSGSGPKYFKVQYKVGSSGTWTDVAGATVAVADDWVTGRLTNLVLPFACDNQPSVSVRWIMTTTEGVNGSPVHHLGTSAIDDISIEGNTGDVVPGYYNVAVTGTFHAITGLSPNTTYYYRVRAASTNSTSANSNAVAVQTDKSSQVITFDPFGAKTVGDAPFSLTASVNSPLAVSYTSSNESVATINGNMLTIVGAGETIITASQAGNAIYYPAESVQQRLMVDKASPIITWSDPAGISYGTALSATQLNAEANEAGTFVYTPASGTLLNAGSHQTLSVTFTPANTENYHTVTRTVNINVAQKTLTPLISVSDKEYDGTTAAAITSRSFGAGEIVGSDDVSLGMSGTALFETATAGQNKAVNIEGLFLSGTGVANYVLSSTTATTTATIRKRTATVTLSSLSQTYTGSPLRATATTNPGGLTVNFTYNGSETAPVNEGSYIVIGTITDDNYQGSGTGTLVVDPVMTTLDVTVQPGVLGGRTTVLATINPVLPNRTIGLTLDGNSLGNAMTNSGGVASWTINACANNSLIVATFGGEINYAPATSNTADLSVATPVYHSNNWSGTNVRNDPQQLPASGGITVIPTITFTGVTLTDVTINWDDKTAPYTTAGPVADYLTITGGHTYTAAGVYSPIVTGKDGCGNLITIPYQYIVIYNPYGGFVTGGGWINSPPKAYKPDGTLTGRANFGFVSRYQKGSTTNVEGETEFQFKLANLHFKGTSYEPSSLVIGGAKASYKGTGTINGAGSYKFMLTAVDGQLTGGGGTDKIRMKITDAAGNLVYDNQVEGTTGDNADPTTVIAGGSVVIHVPKSGSTTSLIAQEKVVTQTESGLQVHRLNAAVYPNPALSQFNLKLTSNNTRDAITLRVYNQLGQVVDVKRNLFSGQVIQVGAAYKQGTYFVEVVQGEQKQRLLVVKTN